MTKSPSVRPATTADAMHLARLIDIAAREPMVTDGWHGDGTEWLPIRKPGHAG